MNTKQGIGPWDGFMGYSQTIDEERRGERKKLCKKGKEGNKLLNEGGEDKTDGDVLMISHVE